MRNHLILSTILLCATACASDFDSDDNLYISIHANLDPQTTAPTWLSRLKAVVRPFMSDAYQLLSEAESVSAGHAWISVKHGETCRTYGLFDGGPTVDKEKKYRPGILRSQKITRAQLLQLQNAIRSRSDYQWTGYYNCASYAADLWRETTGEEINPVPLKTYYVDLSGSKHDIKDNVRLKPLPPSPLGIVQEIIRLSNGTKITSDSNNVCP